DEPGWLELSALESANSAGGVMYGRDAWFNALPPYLQSRPLWQYAFDSAGPAAFNRGNTVYHCPTAASQPLDAGLNADTRPIFHYGMNSKGLWEEGGTVQVTRLKTSLVKNPSAFVMFSDNRVRADEQPYFGTDAAKAKTLGSPQNYTSRFSSRHDGGGDIAFSDGHAAFFKYSYVCLAYKGKPCDPGRLDIHWGHDGTSVDGLSAP
ncbi:MAG TPA: hypothetical protein VHH73_13300, partial [Verrucomicrobiae bacterium]|nr:hypothetical protein [Verrucomicrobiae bacterium]